ncbi:MAG: PorT family protein [Cyclobacteriaceae bacterium]|nr:PorT family protein [Cyclobacteriaceae bacterium]
MPNDKKVLLSFLTGLVIIFLSGDLQAQPKPGYSQLKKSKGQMETTQWWLAVRGGVNLSSAEAGNTYAVLSYTQPDMATRNQATYHSFRNPGTAFGFLLGCEFADRWSILVMPSYITYIFAYKNTFSWQSTANPEMSVIQEDVHRQRMHYLEMPLLLRYELKKGKIKPFIQGGAFAGRLTKSIRDVETSTLDGVSGGEALLMTNAYSGSTDKYLIKSHLGWLAGAGAMYNLGNARLGLELNFRQSFHRLNNPSTRYADSGFTTGLLDVMDDFSLRNLELAISCMIPLKFITSKDYVPL